jgi:hypothetical protein
MLGNIEMPDQLSSRRRIQALGNSRAQALVPECPRCLSPTRNYDRLRIWRHQKYREPKT